jgi:hypothetical protein
VVKHVAKNSTVHAKEAWTEKKDSPRKRPLQARASLMILIVLARASFALSFFIAHRHYTVFSEFKELLHFSARFKSSR